MRLLKALLVWLSLSLACSDEPTCSAGRVSDCVCPSGGPGVQRCSLDGERLEACACVTTPAPASMCMPNSRRACTCTDGTTAEQTCLLDGKDFGACACATTDRLTASIAKIAAAMAEHNARCVGAVGDLVLQFDPAATRPSELIEASLRTVVQSESTVFDLEQTDACVASLRGPCGREAEVGVPLLVDRACPSLFTGVRQLGQACVFHAECSTGFCAKSSDASCGKCASAQPGLNEPCGLLGPSCGPGQVCGPLGCEKRLSVGEACADGVCAEGLFCPIAGARKCAAPPALGARCLVDDGVVSYELDCGAAAVCSKGVCAPRAAAGSACELDAQCQAGLYCAIERPAPVCSTVLVGSKVGDPCVGSCGYPWQTGLSCKGSPAGVCEKIVARELGEPCADSVGLPLSVCKGGFSTHYCDQSAADEKAWKCAMRPTLGQSCSADVPCNTTTGTCLTVGDASAVCGTYPLLGEACWNVCAEGLTCKRSSPEQPAGTCVDSTAVACGG